STGRYEQAEAALNKAAELSELGHEPLYQIVGLATSARLAHRRGEDQLARTLLADARRQLGEQPDPGWATESVSEASRELRFAPRAPSSQHDLPLQPITPRELAVLRLLPTDLTRAEIASELHVSLATVKSHLHSMARKFAVSSRSDIVERAQESGQL
ncbi:MAG: response regulator transcription factor, partial [Acidimicrobiales bacterium]